MPRVLRPRAVLEMGGCAAAVHTLAGVLFYVAAGWFTTLSEVG